MYIDSVELYIDCIMQCVCRVFGVTTGLSLSVGTWLRTTEGSNQEGQSGSCALLNRGDFCINHWFGKDRAEMYVGEDVSPDFYAWVFPKCDHVAVGTGTVVDKKGIQRHVQKLCKNRL